MKSLKRVNFSKEERNMWRNIEVNIDSFSDRWEDKYKNDFEKKLEILSDNFIKIVLEHFGVSLPSLRSEYKVKLLEDRRNSILLYSVIIFSHKNPKYLSEIFKYKIVNREVDKVKVIERVFKAYAENKLIDLFLYLLKLRFGKGKFPSNFSEDLKESDYVHLENHMSKLGTFLRRREKDSKKYHFRFGYKSVAKDAWIFLLLKETNDRVYHAIPNNISMVSGTYKLIVIYPKARVMEIHAGSKGEALLMRNYINSKLDNHHTYVRNERKYQPSKFFEKVFATTGKTNLSLIDAKFKKSNIGVKIHLTDTEKKNDIITQLKHFKKAQTLKLDDFSEFAELTFYFNGLNIQIDVTESVWGTHLLNLRNRNIPDNDISDFKKQFQNKYKLPLDIWLKRKDETANKHFIISKILDVKTVPTNTITDEIEEIILELIDNKILNKVQKQAKRECTHCYHKTWQNGSCPKCGNDMQIIGEYLDLKPNILGIREFVYKTLKKTGDLKVSKSTVQINSHKHLFIELMAKTGDPISLYISEGDVPQDVVNHFKDNALPLLIVLTRFKEALAHNLKENNFECIGLVDLYISYKGKQYSRQFTDFIDSQKMKWKQKLLDKGYASFEKLTKKNSSYTPQNFETDIFNMLHEIMYVAFKLGGSFTGIKAPDGIASVQNYSKPLKKFCLSWDCKYSIQKKGYQISEPAKKHRHYITVLTKNSKVKFYGSLKAHAIISNNMDSAKYEKFYSELTDRFRWKGKVIFIQENVIAILYSFYRQNSSTIISQPTIFYGALYKLFSKIYVKDLSPYPSLTEERIQTFIKDVSENYASKSITLTFERSDFK